MARDERVYRLYHRDGVQLCKLAEEVIRQVGFFERNTQEEGRVESDRFTLIQLDISKMQRIAARAVRRWERSGGWSSCLSRKEA